MELKVQYADELTSRPPYYEEVRRLRSILPSPSLRAAMVKFLTESPRWKRPLHLAAADLDGDGTPDFVGVDWDGDGVPDVLQDFEEWPLSGGPHPGHQGYSSQWQQQRHWREWENWAWSGHYHPRHLADQQPMFRLTAGFNQTVKELKKQISQREGQPVEVIGLSLGGSLPLEDHMELHEYNLRHNDTVTLHVHPDRPNHPVNTLVRLMSSIERQERRVELMEAELTALAHDNEQLRQALPTTARAGLTNRPLQAITTGLPAMFIEAKRTPAKLATNRYVRRSAALSLAEPAGPLWWRNKATRTDEFSPRSVIGALQKLSQTVEAAWGQIDALDKENRLLRGGIDPVQPELSLMHQALNAQMDQLDRKWAGVNLADQIVSPTRFDEKAVGLAGSGHSMWLEKPKCLALELTRREKLGRVFDKVDASGRGLMDADDLKMMAEIRRQLGHKTGSWSAKKNTHLLTKIDKDRDGQIGRREFLDYYDETLPERMEEFDMIIGQFTTAAQVLLDQREQIQDFVALNRARSNTI